MKILLIDDDSFFLKVLARQISRLGYSNSVCFENAKDALVYIATNSKSVDVVFCDLQMPEMDGVQFVRHLVGAEYQGGLVLVSGENERILHTAVKLAKAHQLDVLGSLNKPVSNAKLVELLCSERAPIKIVDQKKGKTYGPDELRHALSNNQLENYYQPQVDIPSGKLRGVEALVRWRHPDDGLVYPDQFIGAAEEHCLIDDLTQVVLANALSDARHWWDSGLRIHVSVNISMDNLADLDFPDLIEKQISDAGVPPSSLLLEVTESRLMKDPRAQLDIFTRIRLKNVGLSIDDFGTGYSTLAQLRDIPFDELKIDRGFVHGVHADSSIRAIFDANVKMAQQLGMTTVAEGVEDQNDWDFLCTSGCDIGQGYFIAKPMPANDLLSWKEDWDARLSEKREPIV